MTWSRSRTHRRAPPVTNPLRFIARRASMAMAAAVTIVAPGRAAGPAVTIYSHDLGYVRESRALELSRDRDTVLIDVPERLDFSSVRLVPQNAPVGRLGYHFC